MCLQRTMADHMYGPGFGSCADVEAFAVQSHAACYTDAAHSACTFDTQLQWGDMWHITTTVAREALSLKFYTGAYEVYKACSARAETASNP